MGHVWQLFKPLAESLSECLQAIGIGAEQPLTALVTRGSAADLGLALGVDVVVSFKTTATRATPRQQP